MPAANYPFSVFASWLAPLLDLLYPPRCASCGRAGAWLCPSCQAEIAAFPLFDCPLCGSPAGEFGGPCWPCRHRESSLSGILATAAYLPPLRPAILAFKYRGLRVLARPFATRLAGAWLASGLAADVIVPVPLHRQREAERGYNQAALLADSLSRQLHLPVACGIIARVRPTSSQTSLNFRERQENMRDAFAARGDRALGQRILLVDDVCTTGATLAACAAVLHAAGAVQVWGLAVARAFGNKNG